jgi:hypothetical protein
MNKKIYLSILVVVITVGIAGAGSNERDRSDDKQSISMAEKEFVSQCVELNEIYRKDLNKLEKCLPEVIILDQKFNIVAAESHVSLIVEHLIMGLEFITNILGTEYYSLNYKDSQSAIGVMTDQ